MLLGMQDSVDRVQHAVSREPAGGAAVLACSLLSEGDEAVASSQDELARLHDDTRRALRFMLNFMNANADAFLQSLMHKAQNRVERADLKAAGREWTIRSIRLRECFATRVLDAFDRACPRAAGEMVVAAAATGLALEPQGLGLVQHDRLEESLAIENLVARAETAHRAALLALAHHFMRLTGKRRLEPTNLPLAPLELGRNFLAAVDEVGVLADARQAFVQLFGRFVLGELGRFYAECLRGMPLEPQDEEQEASQEEDPGSDWSLQEDLPTIIVENEAEPAEANAPEIVWDATGTPLLAAPGKAMALPGNLLDEILLDLQRDPLGQGRAQASLNPKAGVLPLEIYVLLNGALEDMGQQTPLALTMDMIEAVNLVRLLFERVLRDPRIAPPVLRLLRLLQIPVLRAALLDPEVLSTAEHPVRAYLGELVEAVIGWVPPAERGSDAFFRNLQHAVSRIVNGFRTDVDVFRTSLSDFRAGVRAYQARVRLLERHAAIAELGRQEREATRAAVAQEITACLGDALLPRLAVDFMRGSLSDALFVIRLQYGVDSLQWREAQQAIDALMAFATERPGATFAAAMPRLFQALRTLGLEEDVASAELRGLERILRPTRTS